MKKMNAFLLILFLIIGFAAVSTNLFINVIANIGENKEDFDVIFYSAMLDELVVSSSVISEDKKTINYSTNELTIPNESSVLVFSVLNNSSFYDAEVSIECNIPLSNEYSVSVTPEEMVISAGKRRDGTISVNLNKSLIEAKEINFSCKLISNAIERDSSVDKVYDRTNYDVVLVGDSIMNGYGNDQKSFDYYLKNDGLANNVLNLSENGAMLFNSTYVDEKQLILENQIRMQLFGKAVNIRDGSLLIMNGGANDLVYNLQYDSYKLGVESVDDFLQVSYFSDVMNSDNLVKRIYDSLSGVATTFPNVKIFYIKPRLIPSEITKYYKDTNLINDDIALFNQAIDIWEERIGSKKYPNLHILDSNDYILESDLKYSSDSSDGLHWLESAYLKMYDEIKKIN